MYSEIHQKITEAFRKGTYFPNLYKKHLAESLDSDIMQVIIEAAAKAACEVIDPVMQVVTETLTYPSYGFVHPRLGTTGINMKASYGQVIEMRDHV
jgi:hypothetical protein